MSPQPDYVKQVSERVHLTDCLNLKKSVDRTIVQ